MIAEILSLPAIASALSSCLLTSAIPQPNAPQTPFSVSSSSSSVPDGQYVQPQQGYHDQQVWRLDWSSFNQTSKRDIMTLMEILNLDIWHASPSQVDVRLSPSQLNHLVPYIPSSSSGSELSDTFSPFITDLQSLIDLSTPSSSSTQDTPAATSGPITAWNLSDISTPFHDSYHGLEELYAFGDSLVDNFNGLNGIHMDTFVVGETFQDREIRGWKAWMVEEEQPGPQRKGGSKGGGGRPRRPKQELEFVVQSGQHAREWVGPSTALYFLHSLLLSATSDGPDAAGAKLALKTFTFTVVPTINPDGFVYSHEHSRMWRKNRQYIGGGRSRSASTSPGQSQGAQTEEGGHMTDTTTEERETMEYMEECVGIDLNSNWGYKWRAPVHNNPCAETYSGKNAFEAYETRAMADYLLSVNGPSPLYQRDDVDGGAGEARAEGGRRIRAFVDLHSYGQLFMYPFAHSCDDFPFDAENLMEASLGVAKAMKDRDGELYATGQACDLTYRAPGDAIDFAYGSTDVRWSFSTELRDTGVYGFLLPPEYIRPTGEEITAGLISLAKFIYTTEIAG